MRNRCLAILLIKYAQFVGRHVNFIWEKCPKYYTLFGTLEPCKITWLQSIETLNVKDMAKNKKLSKSILNEGLRILEEQSNAEKGKKKKVA